MPKHGKNYKNAVAKVDGANLYSPKEAVTLSKELATAKFDETIEVAIRLGVDTRKADQNVRGSISLPHGTGKSVRVAVFAEGEKAREAEAAGADIVGGDELIAEVEKGMLDFDAAIATPQMMGNEYRADRFGICHVAIGKASFEVQQLVENYGALISEIIRVKPSSAKGKYVKTVAISSTMGPGIKVDPTKVRNLMED